MTRLTLVTSIIVITCAIAFPARAEDKDDWIQGKLFTPEVILRNQAKLRITDAQRQAIGVELKRVQAQAAESDWEIMSEGLEIQELIGAYPVDAAKVLPRVDQILAAENRKKRLYIEMLINLKNLLSAEQVAVLKAAAGAP